MKFSIFIVTLNSGDALNFTISSVLKQKDADFEIIVKDGGSTDKSVENIIADDRIKVFVQSDNGIYDAMNQAIEYSNGDYGIFMNCGDAFFDDNTLKNVATYIDYCTDKILYYGDCYTANRDYVLKYPDEFNDYVCFTKTLCHQATIYPINLLKARKFRNDYKIAADFEYYVYAYKHGYVLKHIPETVATYMGDGASESKKNRRLGLLESDRALKENFNKKDYIKNQLKLQFHGIGIKRFLVKLEWFYPLYRKCASIYYRIIKNNFKRKV